MFTAKILIFLLLINGISCGRKPNPLLPEFIDFLFIMLILWLACLIRFVLIRYNVPTPCEFFMVIFGILWGVVVNYYDMASVGSRIIYIPITDILHIYFPTIIFCIAFCIDVPIFLKTLPQIMVIGILVSVLTSLFFGSVMLLIISSYRFTIIRGFLFGLFAIPVDPDSIVYLLKRQSTRTKQISILLEGEALISLVITEMAYLFYEPALQKIITKWYQIISVLLRFLILDPLVGIVMGQMSRFMIRKMYTDRVSVYVLIFGVPFFTFAITKGYISGCGGLAVAILGAMMSQERAALSRDIDDFLTDSWAMIAFSMKMIVSTFAGIYFSAETAPLLNTPHSVMTGFVAYLVYYLARFNSFLFFSPLLSRLGYGMDLKNMLVCVWSGIKSPFSLFLSRDLIANNIQYLVTQRFYYHMMWLYVISLVVNGSFMRTILKFLGLRQITLARQLNMNNCVKHVMMIRAKSTAILKMDRFLCDTNWLQVSKVTNMQHPYRLESPTDDDDEFFIGYRYTFCPDCDKEVPHEPTAKEFNDMKKEARMRVLKAKKMSYSRQFENGMMSKEAIRILSQAVELAMDSKENVIEIEGLQHKFTQESYFSRFIRDRVHEINKSKGSSRKLPRSSTRRLFYYAVFNKTWERFMLLVIAFHVIGMSVLFNVHSPLVKNVDSYEPPTVFEYTWIFFEACFLLLYTMEFVMKLFAYSWISVWKNGCPKYFKSFWNVTDLVAMVVCDSHAIYAIQDISTPEINSNSSQTFHEVIDVLRFLFRPIRLLRIFEIFYPKVIRYLDKNVDSNLALTYELGKSYATGEAEILDMLPNMIDNKKIRDEIKKKIEADRIIITKLLGVVQKDKPWIAITVKSKQAIRTILKSMNDSIRDLKNSGWVDRHDLGKLKDGMDHLYKKVNAMKSITPCAPKTIFREVAWMNNEKEVIDFLFENVTVKTFKPGDIVFTEGEVSNRIYIVVTGLFMITYNPNDNILGSWKEYGRLPIVDYLAGTKYQEPFVDYIVSGNCIGELSFLTNRAFNCVITADAHSQVYVLSSGIIRRGMELSPDPIIGLECRIWKEVSIRIAMPILMTAPQYQSFSQDEVKYTLERAFVPDLSNYKIFVVTEMIEDIVLIDGIVSDFNSREIFVAPYCIPRTVQKLILPTSSQMNITIDGQTKLLIIPEKDVDEYDVMIEAEETCELVATGSASKCLQHTVQYKAKERKRNKMKALDRRTKHVKGGGGDNISTVKESAHSYFVNKVPELASSYNVDLREKLAAEDSPQTK